MGKSLIIVRHGIAEDREAFSKTKKSDALRPLTSEGIKKMKDVAKWLDAHLHSPVDIIYQSPLLRSQQTAKILTDHLKFGSLEELEALDPKFHPEQLCRQLDQRLSQSSWEKVIVVGHEPQLTMLLAFLLGQDEIESNPYKFKKGGIACVDIDQSFMSQKAKLSWLVTPKIILQN